MLAEVLCLFLLHMKVGIMPLAFESDKKSIVFISIIKFIIIIIIIIIVFKYLFDTQIKLEHNLHHWQFDH